MALALCIFCGGGPTTDEDLFPDWINKEFGDLKGLFEWQALPGDGGEGRSWKARKLASIRYRVVCGPCNNGWMSRQEEKVKPILVDFITGKARKLTQQEQLELGVWATIKAYVRDANTSLPVSDQQSRQTLMDHLMPAQNVRVFISTLKDHGTFGCWHHQVNLAEQKVGQPGDGFSFTIVLGHGVVQVIGRKDADFRWAHHPALMEAEVRSVIPPYPSGDIEWPTAGKLTKETIDQFGREVLNVVDTVKSH